MMKQPLRQLAQFDLDTFINEYWQKKPLLIRQGLPHWENPITPDELAGLSLEEEIESRIVSQVETQGWQLEHGPFEESRYAALGESHWSLLVQAVDKHVSSLAILLDYFTFIPSWQIDDVMVSFATKGGGVGPHFDRYDVFLVQGQGQREWQLGQVCDSETVLNNENGLLQLDNFECQTKYILEPGDILYVPPYLSHSGTSLDNECMTYSVGFRSPALSDLIDDFATYLQTQLTEDERMRAPLIAPNNSANGAIDPTTIALFKAQMTALMDDEKRLSKWLGCWATLPKQSEMETETQLASEQEIETIWNQLMALDVLLIRSSSARFHYIEENANNPTFAFFSNGREIDIDKQDETLLASIKQVCNSRSFSSQLLAPWSVNKSLREVIADSILAGTVYGEELNFNDE
ncbi:MAG: cupin domain-containing protein [Pseudomonadales bacterium]|nr:cupin domain-containing protein [Pseudomonadales bacterium]